MGTQNDNEHEQRSENADLFGFLLWILVLTICWGVWLPFCYDLFTRWSGIEPDFAIFQFFLLLSSAGIFVLLFTRYDAKISETASYFGYREESANLKNWVLVIMASVLVALVAGIILLAIIAFIIGTLFSLELNGETDISPNETFAIVPLFILGVTIVTLTIGEGLKKIDEYIATNSDTSDKAITQKIDNNHFVSEFNAIEEE